MGWGQKPGVWGFLLSLTGIEEFWQGRWLFLEKKATPTLKGWTAEPQRW
jgi:hypothetical protein